jgi:hypothetical protein
VNSIKEKNILLGVKLDQNRIDEDSEKSDKINYTGNE